jgi:dethiobiotin synthetase
MGKSLMVAGTNLGVGKSLLVRSLTAYAQMHYPQRSISTLKLIETGTATPKTNAPIHFTTPLAPPLAAIQAEQSIDLGKLWQVYRHHHQESDLVLVEGWGGLGDGLTWETTGADLAQDWRIPVVLVIPVGVGAIGTAVAYAALAKTRQLKLVGIVFNCLQSYRAARLEELCPIDLIQSLTQVPVLGILPYLLNLEDKSKLAQIISNLDLEILLPYFSYS